MSRELCIMACVFCRDPQFQKWAGEQVRAQRYVFFGGDVDMSVSDERLAKRFVMSTCHIDSRNDLDTDPDAAERFHDQVRKPFLAWKEGQAQQPNGETI